MTLLLFSKSLTSLDVQSMSTSSQKFELSLARNIAKASRQHVTICSSALPEEVLHESGSLRLIGCGSTPDSKISRTLDDFIQAYGEERLTIMFYGYDLQVTLMMLRLKRIYHVSVLTFIFDTHVGAIERYSFLKRMLASAYFGVAIRLLRRLDGYVFFQPEAPKELRLRPPYLITKPGVDRADISSRQYGHDSEVFTITYVGSLMVFNCIGPLLKAFELCRGEGFRLRIFGSGDLEGDVIDLCDSDSRVFYGGVIEQDRVQVEFEHSDLLISLRDPNHYVCKFAYPSKLIEYMATGIPVLSTDFGIDDELRGAIHVVDTIDPQAICDKFVEIRSMDVELKRAMAERAKAYLMKNNNWDVLAAELYAFISAVEASAHS